MSPGSDNATPSKTSSTHWTWHENKVFENAIAVVPEDLPNRWEKIAAQLPGKSLEEIKDHYDALVRDVKDIESGLVELPDYRDDVEASAERVWDSVNLSSSEFRRRRSKSNPWTEEEHMLFLMGMEEYGRGDWRGISTNFVATRTPTQIASHAQKYFPRQSSTNKESRRASINEITTVDTNVAPPAIGQTCLESANNERTPSFPDIITMLPRSPVTGRTCFAGIL
ncbi:hypothetical protein L6164_008585 [Bauhinia variegata]|uniref:Uncharacterized protein n=1 Tax=Bauhinia variegata TaxID=167791 RepID=A0ACB9PGY3_BAUVA|nr:hypothetical protein L6164_008585 [Bauhinia variegata]